MSIEQSEEAGAPPRSPTTLRRSAEEGQMRALIVPQLRKRYPDARIVHELPLRYSSRRIDLAAIAPTKIVSVEIKSSKDIADRLEAQLRAFLPVSARVIVALAPKWNEELPSLERETKYGKCYSPQYTEAQKAIRDVQQSNYGGIEVWTVDAAAGSIDGAQSGWRDNNPWHFRMLDMLHVAELSEIAGRHRISIGKRPTHIDIVEQCNALMSGREIIAAVCRALRERAAFAAESDPPIIGVTPQRAPTLPLAEGA